MDLACREGRVLVLFNLSSWNHCRSAMGQLQCRQWGAVGPLNQTSHHATVSCSSTPLSKANVQVWSANTAPVDFARAIDTPKPSGPPFSTLRHATITFLLPILPCWLPFIVIIIIIIDRFELSSSIIAQSMFQCMLGIFQCFAPACIVLKIFFSSISISVFVGPITTVLLRGKYQQET